MLQPERQQTVCVRLQVYDQFDDILLLANGRVVYHGPRPEVEPYFDTLGFRCIGAKAVADFLQVRAYMPVWSLMLAPTKRSFVRASWDAVAGPHGPSPTCCRCRPALDFECRFWPANAPSHILQVLVRLGAAIGL